MNRIRQFSLAKRLRPDVKVNGLESWLVTQLREVFTALGDTSTKPYNRKDAVATSALGRSILKNLVHSSEYCWLVYEGLDKGVSLSTLQLIRWSLDEVIDQMWELADAAVEAADEWRNIISFFKCVALKPEIKAPENQVPYIRNPAGMKIEARGIRFKYDCDDKKEILKGASFIINPGAMVAIVG
jgi:ABC-type multidrug transport system fused ATPase/permease subunit